MPDYQLSFDSPWWLALLALVPLFWALGWRSLTSLGRVRRWTVLGVRSLVLLVLAMAEVQAVRTTDRLTVIYLLDQSSRRWNGSAVERRLVATRLEQVRTACRFEPLRDVRSDTTTRETAADLPCAEFEAGTPSLAEGTVDEMGYTDRLLQAKQRARQDRRGN